MSETIEKFETTTWVTVGELTDLTPDSGVGALVRDHQVALFWLPEQDDALYAVSNYCPFSGVHLIARGIVGDVDGEPVVATPLYKQHFSLLDGRCLEEPDCQLTVYPVRFRGQQVQVGMAAASEQAGRSAA